MRSPADILEGAAALQRERFSVYGRNYIDAGKALAAMFPDGIDLRSPRDHCRYHLLSWLVGKLTRYTANWERGGHADSIRDAAVYASLIEYVDGLSDSEFDALAVHRP